MQNVMVLPETALSFYIRWCLYLCVEQVLERSQRWKKGKGDERAGSRRLAFACNVIAVKQFGGRARFKTATWKAVALHWKDSTF
jgi:hypothetical protein